MNFLSITMLSLKRYPTPHNPKQKEHIMGNLNELLGNGFNAADHAGNGGEFTPLPDGKYIVVVESAEIKPTRAGDGRMLKLQLGVTGPTHQGRKLFDNLLLAHPKPVVVEIAQERFASICTALGKPAISDTQELVGAEMMARVKAKGDSNDVLGYHAKTVIVAPAPTAAPTPGDAGSEGGGGMPWDQ